MDKTTPMKLKPLVNATCKLGNKGCFEDGRCHAIVNCENKIMTNADRIRAMSDEELAKERIDRIDMYTKSDFKEYIGDFAGIVNSEEEAIEKELVWLQSEPEPKGE